jgi:DNA replication ATP-dependent helicase Dna2
MLHGLLQSALQEQDFEIDSTRRRLDEELSKETTRIDLWGADLGVEDVRLEVGIKAGHGFETFGRKWVGAKVTVRLQDNIDF